MSPKFNKAAETLEERQARLEAYGKMLDESLRKPPQKQMRFTLGGKVKQGADQIARQATEHRRETVMEEVERIKTELRERDRQEQRLQQRRQQRQSL